MATVNCLSGCDDTLPVVSFNEDCGGDVFASEIEEIYVAKADASAFADWTDPAEWATRLSQSATLTGNEIRKLTVVGEKPAAQPVTVNISKQRKKKVNATQTLNFEIDDVSQENYDFALRMQCGVYKRIWYKIRGGKMFGGNEGIKAYIELNPSYGKGDEIEKLIGSATWNSKQDPERIDSPL